jgi:hypothetical protein
MSYVDDADFHTYSAQLDLHEFSDDTMTDEGALVGDLQSIEDCVLTPGHPSPIGRTQDGDLAYPVHELESWVQLDRRFTAELAHLYAKAHGITEMPQMPLDTPVARNFYNLITEAVPEVLFGDSNHQQIAYQGAIKAVIQGDWEKYPDDFCRPRQS